MRGQGDSQELRREKRPFEEGGFLHLRKAREKRRRRDVNAAAGEKKKKGGARRHYGTNPATSSKRGAVGDVGRALRGLSATGRRAIQQADREKTGTGQAHDEARPS